MTQGKSSKTLCAQRWLKYSGVNDTAHNDFPIAILFDNAVYYNVIELVYYNHLSKKTKTIHNNIVVLICIVYLIYGGKKRTIPVCLS